jgi:alpha-beta hydrolase superfamily lysophospholipase
MSRDAAQVEDARRDPLLVRHATPRWYLGCLAAQREVMARADRFRLPALILIGGDDPVSDPEAAAEFARAARNSEITFQRLPGLRHELLREVEREAVFAIVWDWIRARLAGGDPDGDA